MTEIEGILSATININTDGQEKITYMTEMDSEVCGILSATININTVMVKRR